MGEDRASLALFTLAEKLDEHLLGTKAKVEGTARLHEECFEMG